MKLAGKKRTMCDDNVIKYVNTNLHTKFEEIPHILYVIVIGCVKLSLNKNVTLTKFIKLYPFST